MTTSKFFLYVEAEAINILFFSGFFASHFRHVTLDAPPAFSYVISYPV